MESELAASVVFTVALVKNTVTLSEFAIDTRAGRFVVIAFIAAVVFITAVKVLLSAMITSSALEFDIIAAISAKLAGFRPTILTTALPITADAAPRRVVYAVLFPCTAESIVASSQIVATAR